MKNYFRFIRIPAMLLLFLLFGCHTNVIDDMLNEANSNDGNFAGYINIPDMNNVSWDDCKITSIADEVPLKDGKFKVKAYANGKTQTFFVGDEMNIYLISRTPLQEGDQGGI